MKLNLKRYNCKVFILSSDISVSSDMDREILDFLAKVSYVKDEEGIPNDAMFLSQFKAAGTIEQSLGRLQRLKTDEAVSYRLQITNFVDEEKLSRSRSFKPVLALIDAAADLFGPINILCQATFNYGSSVGYSSRIPLPAPMVSPFQNAITQIEGYQLSYVEPDQKRYVISLSYSEEEDLVFHSINSNFTLALNPNGIRGLRNKFTALSRSLVMQTKD